VVVLVRCRGVRARLKRGRGQLRGVMRGSASAPLDSNCQAWRWPVPGASRWSVIIVLVACIMNILYNGMINYDLVCFS
jgi:hypothetical protein